MTLDDLKKNATAAERALIDAVELATREVCRGEVLRDMHIVINEAGAPVIRTTSGTG